MSTSTTQTRTAARAVEATKIYGSGDTAVIALDGVTLDLPAGRFTAIMGPSGSGKSTLVHCLAGLDGLTGGRVFVGDVELGKLSDKQLTLPLALAGHKPDPGWFDEVIATVDLADGQIVDRMADPTAGRVLDTIKRLGS